MRPGNGVHAKSGLITQKKTLQSHAVGKNVSKLEFLSPEGFRLDGRRLNELRDFRCRIGDLSAMADGSAEVKMGCTQVIAYVFGPSESDGGSFPAAINAAALALIDAGIPLKDFVSGCTVGVIGAGEVLVDLNETEANAVGAELTIAVHGRTKEITCFELDSRIPVDAVYKMESTGKEACEEISTIMRNAVIDRFTHLAAKT
ncbi:uncharacterized protein LOC129618186 [Condylostylus longicornis]|uniref:uncharacterized protein LOC129618186 n=1 Tax=Condylostylus longicornis TaxID=2530218 RepID=UPI00244E03F5|nr:uncharacterized protein LOC129618186 [Condylostylus longicornis]